ncbi:hypothetical protein [Phenylobacterium sp.]|nr:hypothetical protein [Phenylobacterium sp.]MDP3853151.1 hypothetical protein [Phenylobacterium sp.]
MDSGVFGLDFPAFLTMAAIGDVDQAFVADILPAIEPFIVTAWRREET